MKEEIKRIMKLVQDGKLSPEDAAELIEAFQSSPTEPEAKTGTSDESDDSHQDEHEPKKAGDAKDPFSGVAEAIERIGREIGSSANWQEIARHFRESTQKGVDRLKELAENAKKGKYSFIFGNAELKEIDLPLHVPQNKVLRIENPSGDVKIVGGHDVGSVHAMAQIRGHDDEDAKQKASEYMLVIEESEHEVVVKQPDMPGLSVDLHFKVANLVSLEVKCESGDIEIRNTGSSCRVNGKSGDISLEGLNGALDIQTASGDVKIESSQSPSLYVENKSGDISLNKVDGNLSVRTTSGDVSLTNCSGRTLAIEAISGDVSCDLNKPIDGTVNIRTVQGDTSVTIPDGSNCRVALKTLRGCVHSAIILDDETRADQHVHGRIGEGQGSLDISAVSGDVSLTMRNTATV